MLTDPSMLMVIDTVSTFSFYNARFYGPVTEASEKKIAIFASDRGLSILTKGRILSMDGTFHTSPRPFVQLYAIQVRS